MSSDEETAKLFRIWKTTLEMLRDRGFIVLDSDIKMSLREFIDKFGENFKRENLDMFKTKKDDPNDGIFVFFPNEPKLNVKITKRYAERMRTENVLRGIIVVKDAPTPVAKRAIEDLSQKYYIEVFLDAELLVNVNNHMLVPKHEVLSNEEKKELLKRYTVKETQSLVAKLWQSLVGALVIQHILFLHLPYPRSLNLNKRKNTHLHQIWYQSEAWKEQIWSKVCFNKGSISSAGLVFKLLPRMQSNDPIAKYLGIRRGQVVKITRDSETAGKYITYRFVV